MTDDLARAVIVVLAVVVLAPLVMMALFMPFGMMGGMGAWHDGTHMWGQGGAAVVWFVTLVVLVGGGYLLYRSLSGEDTDEALEELRVAYARGELSKEEFEERRENLRRVEEE